MTSVPEEKRNQDDVEIVGHYASADEPACVDALLLLAGYDRKIPTPRVRLVERPADMTPEQWAARVEHAQLTLVRVLLRARERLIAEGKLKP